MQRWYANEEISWLHPESVDDEKTVYNVFNRQRRFGRYCCGDLSFDKINKWLGITTLYSTHARGWDTTTASSVIVKKVTLFVTLSKNHWRHLCWWITHTNRFTMAMIKIFTTRAPLSKYGWGNRDACASPTKANYSEERDCAVGRSSRFCAQQMFL